MPPARTFQAEVVVAGEASGLALVTATPLSFWGGYDAETGEIIDRRHPLSGSVASGRVLVVPSTRGSSTTAAILLEAVRRGTAPAAIVNRGRDTFLALASIVADEMYRRPIPIVSLEPNEFDAIEPGAVITIEKDGRVSVQTEGDPSAKPMDVDVGDSDFDPSARDSTRGGHDG